ncbi:MAG TPA: amidohydrolase family protein [Parvibaculum sp.]
MPFNSVLEIPEMNLIGDATKRRAQRETHKWPDGTTIVSADSHWLEGDLWIDRFPPHLKEHAPRMRFEDGGWQLTVKGKNMMPPGGSAFLCTNFECVPGITSVAERLKDLDTEGVEKELLFPQRLFGLYMAGDIEMREWVFGAYNRYIAEVCAQAPGRLFFVGIPNYWDPAGAKDSIAEIKALGGRCLMVPILPRKDVDGEPIQYSSEKMDPFWAAVEESGLPLCFHIGENIPVNVPGAVGAFVLTQMQGFRPTWGTLTFGGVFDRHPGLRIVFVEGGLSWIPGMLHDADMIYSSFQTSINPKLKHAPSHYWSKHCYATFMTDPVGLEMLHRIGADRVMWSSDYPHQESTFGYTRSAIDAVFKATSVENAQKILGKTALDLFGMT